MTPEQETLWLAYRAGNHHVEGELVEALLPVACSAASTAVRNTPRSDADDLRQHLRLAVLRAVRDWRPGLAAPTTLIWRYAVAAISDWCSSRRRASRTISLPVLPAAAVENPEIYRLEWAEEFSARISALPSEQSRVVTVVFYGSADTQREAANELGLDEKQVSVLKQKALEAVRRAMARAGHPKTR